MQKKKALIILLMAALGIAISIQGCRDLRKHSRKEIEDYIRDRLRVEDFVITGGPVKVKVRSNDDWMWTAETDCFSLSEPVVFHVYSVLGYSGEHSSREIYSDLDYVLEGIMFAEYPGWTDDLCAADTEAYPYGREMLVTRNIRERKDFDAAASEITALAEHLKKRYPEVMEWGMKISFACCFKGERYSDICLPSSTVIFGFPKDIDCSDAQGSLDRCFSTIGYELADGEKRSSFVSSYLEQCLEYGLKGRLEEFTEEERQAIIIGNSYSLAEIVTQDSSGTKHGTGYACRYNRIPYGALFVVLEECGFETEGTWEDFSFMGTDGVIHTFDYGDCRFDFQKRPEISMEEVQEMTGIEVSRREKGGVYIWEIKVPQ